MPLRRFEFKCKSCGATELADKHDAELVCHDKKMLRVYSPVGISFRGSGFYRNDNKK